MNSERLREVRDAYKERKQLAEKIIEFENMRISPRSAVYGSERVQTSARGDIQPDNLAKIEALLERYNAKLARCVDLITEFEAALEKLEPRERVFMRYYYTYSLTLDRITVRMKLSYTQISRIKKSAERKITEEKNFQMV